MLKDFIPRLYQQTILGTAVNYNTLAVLPTGLGKTALAFMLSAQRLNKYPQKKILMLAPTKPLCEQHVQSFQKHLDQKIVLFTGDIKPEKRAELWRDAEIIISTPQGLENDLINKRINLKEVSTLILDEAHHATGDYSYVWLANQYHKNNDSRILALTASPGSDLAKVKEVCNNLHIEKVEVRTEKDLDVKEYIQKTNKNWVEVEFPDEFKKVQTLLTNSRKSKLIEAQKLGLINSSSLNKTDLLKLQGQLQKRISSEGMDFEVLKTISLIAETLKVDHALELLESQGIKPLYTYLNKIRQEALTSKVKATKNLMQDINFLSAIKTTENIFQNNLKHPKLEKLNQIIHQTLNDNKDAKIILFCQFRDSAENIVEELNQQNISNHIFVGQAKKNGLGFSQKKQQEVLNQFRAGDFHVLVATSVAEEGLDIPKVDQVIFYEPIPSAIRSIQRRGRTGRLEEGEVKILLTKGTRDEAYRWSAHHKEKKMYTTLEQIKKSFSLESCQEQKNYSLSRFIPEEQSVSILADHREKGNKVVKELINQGLSVKTGQLTSADYLVSGKVGVELKKVPDFVNSILDGRLLEQVKNLKQNFEKAVVIIEGEEDIYAVRKIHANAIRGMLSSIVLGYGVPVLYTKDEKDTASLLAVMAKREQSKETLNYNLHFSKPRSIQEQQEFIVSSFPNLGLRTAQLLLAHFGSIKEIINADKEEIKKIKGLGEKTAQELMTIFETRYEK